MLDLYKNIKNRRKELGMTQTELALKSGYTNKSSIATIESGRVDLSLSKIKEIAEALECSASYLMGFEDTPEFKAGQEAAKSFKPSLEVRIQMRIEEIMAEIDDDRLNALLKYAEYLYKDYKDAE